MADVQGVDCEESLPCISQKQETRDEMLSRHSTKDGLIRLEISELQNKGINLKKAAAKGSKAEQKAKKKQDHPKPSKCAKRREKRAQQEAAREQRIQDEQSNIVSDRMIEDEKLERKLKPLGFSINKIKPDGHCLYRAVEDQLALLSGVRAGALTHCLRKHIMIFSGSFPDVETGKKNKSDGGSSSEGNLRLSYQKHAFGLGKHYNSAIPNLIR
ncbi:hypothetical protein F3Y22_tig00005459pilonHSYRG00329 [Hibiscus syriacus]|uniref:OTU domain-containing protein n=1 Tax=Hibiscus syriacus TaxID=106335 RepID=A0A6A3CK03_HIBSY|nr:hypothetical protein F3Y22_tig00005459pilonHSYRG00329 [Hibiscus syriacus]